MRTHKDDIEDLSLLGTLRAASVVTVGLLATPAFAVE